MNTIKILLVLVLALNGFVLFSSLSNNNDSIYVTPSDTIYSPRYPHMTYQPEIPSSLSFCDEIVPLDREDVREALDREMLSNTFWHTNTLLVLKRATRYFPTIERILAENKIPNDFKYLCVAESNLLPTAKSPAGAVGLWQIMSTTGKELGLEINDEVDERYDIEKSTQAACKFIRKSYNALGSWALVAASYNGGQARVKKNMSTQMQKSYYDILWVEETARYVYRILSFKTIFANPEKYGFNIEADDCYKPFEYHEVVIDTALQNIAQFAIDNHTTYKDIKRLNPWLRDNKLSNQKNKQYTVKMPK